MGQDWPGRARPDQLPPPGDWLVWLMLGGRGAGKTRAGAEWVRGWRSAPSREAGGPIALVGETLADVREVMVEGVSGTAARCMPRGERPEWQPTRRRLVWPNGAVAQAFSSEDPEACAGRNSPPPGATKSAKWRYPEATWDMLQFGLRLGDTAAPGGDHDAAADAAAEAADRPTKRPAITAGRATTGDNAGNLAPGFLTARRRRAIAARGSAGRNWRAS